MSCGSRVPNIMFFRLVLFSPIDILYLYCYISGRLGLCHQLARTQGYNPRLPSSTSADDIFISKSRPDSLTVSTMTRFALLFSAVLAITCHMCEGFASSGTAFLLTRNRSVVILNGLAQPEVQIKTKTKQETKTRQKVNQKEAVKTGDPISRRDEEFEEPPMFKLLLLGDEGYDKEHVILRLCAIMEDMDEDQANEVFKQAQMAGKAMAGIFPFEKAELIKEQLLRSDPMIFADMAEDKN